MPQSSITLGKAKVAALEFTQGEVDELKAKLLKLTEATVIVRSPKRDDNGKLQYIEVPDVGVQLAATVKALEFSVGKPKQMIEVQPGNGSGNAARGMRDLGALIAQNPDLAIKVIGALKDGVNLSQAIDVTPVKPAQISDQVSNNH